LKRRHALQVVDGKNWQKVLLKQRKSRLCGPTELG
jgi:hypothetical protein